jgi:hypothetical protein
LTTTTAKVYDRPVSKSQIIRPIEWSSKGRKWEVRDRGLNNKDRRLAIAEQLDSVEDETDGMASG